MSRGLMSRVSGNFVSVAADVRSGPEFEFVFWLAEGEGTLGIVSITQ